MVKQLVAIFWFIITFLPAFSQYGGDNVYDFLNLTNSARVAALGGQQISLFDDDLNMVYHNPSLLNGSMSDQLVLNFVPYISDIKFGYVSYARTIEKYGNLGAGIHYIDYGEFISADEYGHKTGTFGAAEYSFNLYYSRPVFDSLFHIGGTLKFINSNLETYHSFGMAIDAGITYASDNRLFSTAFVIKNLGTQFTTYYEGADHESLPFELQFGLSQRLEHAPFRISILVRHLETPNLRYSSELNKMDEINNISGETKKESKIGNLADNVMRHMVFGLEFIPSKYFDFRVGYNYKRRQELKIDDKAGFVGFSWGIGLRIKMFHFSYGRASYHLGGASNHLSVAVKLDEFKKVH